MRALTYKLNAYFAVLIITIFGSGAALLIIHVARADNLARYTLGAEAPVYSALNSAGKKK